ncbi:MAG: hypothetical protein ACOCWB_08750 [Bacteroidota bacterium]
MKKKNVTYLLLVIVIVVWGIILYKIYEYISTDSDKSSPMAIDTTSFQETTIPTDTFSLSLDYQDPFLKKQLNYRTKPSLTKKHSHTPKKTQPKITKQTIQKTIWPHITYDGMIRSDETNLALLQINNQSYIIALGEEEKNIHVKQLFQDSILLLYKDEEKYFFKH